MADSEPHEPTVHLEDIEPASFKAAKSVELNEGLAKPSASSNPESKKRQRTIADMFFVSSQEKQSGSQHVAKKLKLNASNSSILPPSSASSKVAKSDGYPKLNAIPFSLFAFRESLDAEARQLLQLECELLGKSWLKLLNDEITKPYFLKLKRFLSQQGVRGLDDSNPSVPTTVYPAARDIYTWSKTPLGKVKVVILGQDPYHGPGQAHGLCFSVPVGVTIPPSLRNIYTELKAEFPHFVPPKHGNLMAWAINGVLMLNTCLTVKAGEAGSHENQGWEQFTDKVIDVVDRYGGANLPNAINDGSESTGIGRGVVFLAWGSWAAKRVAKLNKSKHLILTSAHPSPFSAHRGFFGNGHFIKANSWLEKKYGAEEGVNWYNLDLPTEQ